MDAGFFLGPVIGGYVYSLTGDYSVMFLTIAIPAALAMVVLALTWPGYMRRRHQLEELESSEESEQMSEMPLTRESMQEATT
jgi:MFS family permease